MSQIKQMMLAVILGISVGIIVPITLQFGASLEKILNPFIQIIH